MTFGSPYQQDVWIWLIVWIALTWLFLYSVVRAAVGHAMDRRKMLIVAHATTTADAIHITLANKGVVPAYSVAAWWSNETSAQTMVRTPLLGIDDVVEWVIPAQVPADTREVRFLTVQWRNNLQSAGNERTTSLPVLVPPRWPQS